MTFSFSCQAHVDLELITVFAVHIFLLLQLLSVLLVFSVMFTRVLVCLHSQERSRGIFILLTEP